MFSKTESDSLTAILRLEPGTSRLEGAVFSLRFSPWHCWVQGKFPQKSWWPWQQRPWVCRCTTRWICSHAWPVNWNWSLDSSSQAVVVPAGVGKQSTGVTPGNRTVGSGGLGGLWYKAGVVRAPGSLALPWQRRTFGWSPLWSWSWWLCWTAWKVPWGSWRSGSIFLSAFPCSRTSCAATMVSLTTLPFSP